MTSKVESRNESEYLGESIVVLYKGGRLPTWHALPPEQRRRYEQTHVDLMLGVARKHGMLTLEGFQLLTPHQEWERFWLIEFPALAGAESWIESEMAPPYGSYGHYEYYLARRRRQDVLASLVTNPAPPVVPSPADPHLVPYLEADRASVLLLRFGRWVPGATEIDPETRGDAGHEQLVQAVARQHGLMRLEAFKLVAPQAAWHWVWLMEFPELAGAEAWIAAEVQLPFSRHVSQMYVLARKWAPAYFAAWVSR